MPPDVCKISVSMSQCSAAAATKTIRAAQPASRIFTKASMVAEDPPVICKARNLETTFIEPRVASAINPSSKNGKEPPSTIIASL